MKKLIAIALTLISASVFAEGTVDGSLNTNSGNTNSNNDHSTNTYSDTSDHSVTQMAADLSESVPVVYTPGLATGGVDTCLGSSAGGVSGPGFGASLGRTVVDENCVRIKNAKIFANLGLKDAAVALLMQSDANREAMLIAYPELARKFIKEEKNIKKVTHVGLKFSRRGGK